MVNVLKHFQEVYELAVWTETFQKFPEVISEVYTRCTEHWGPPNVYRIAKVQVVVEIFKITFHWNASYIL